MTGRISTRSVRGTGELRTKGRRRYRRTEEGFYHGRVGLGAGSSSSGGGNLEGAERLEEVEGVLVDVEAQRVDLDLREKRISTEKGRISSARLTFMTISS